MDQVPRRCKATGYIVMENWVEWMVLDLWVAADVLTVGSENTSTCRPWLCATGTMYIGGSDSFILSKR